jgi:SAM-dependent methyltransferase
MEANVFREMAFIQNRHWWFVARSRILASVVNQLSLPPEANILEIGCGTGGNLAMLSSFGNLSAMEYDDNARNFAANLEICSVVSGGLPEPVPFDDGKFDLVCLLDVLEHIDGDEAAISRAGRLLSPSGRLLVTVPAYTWLWSAHDVSHHHYRRYTAKLLRQRAEKANLVVEKLGYFNTLLFPMIAVARLVGKLSGSGSSSDAAMPPSWLNGLLMKIFSFERHVVPKAMFPFGTSILAVFSKAP